MECFSYTLSLRNKACIALACLFDCFYIFVRHSDSHTISWEAILKQPPFSNYLARPINTREFVNFHPPTGSNSKKNSSTSSNHPKKYTAKSTQPRNPFTPTPPIKPTQPATHTHTPSHPHLVMHQAIQIQHKNIWSLTYTPTHTLKPTPT